MTFHTMTERIPDPLLVAGGFAWSLILLMDGLGNVLIEYAQALIGLAGLTITVLFTLDKWRMARAEHQRAALRAQQEETLEDLRQQVAELRRQINQG